MKGYLSPKIFPSETFVHRDIMTSTEPEICAEGPARTSKTNRNLLKAFALHAKYPGFRSCVVRVNAVDLTDTVRYDISNVILRYSMDDPRSQIKQQGGLTRFDHLYMNEGEMRLGGMDRPSSVLGGKYDLLIFSELSQFTEEQFQLLKTRCSGDSAKWRLKNGDICFQVLADTNPDAPSHWMYQREAEGLMRFIKFDFKDNPYYFRQGRWSRVGKTSVNELDRAHSGIYHDRYFKGLRKAPEGMVFEMDNKHYIDELPNLKEYLIYRCMDFGIEAPNVCIWYGVHRETRDRVIFRDYRTIGEDIIEFGNAVRELSREPVVETYIDNDEHRQRLLLRHCQMPTTLARKGPGSIMDGVMLIRRGLRNTIEGLPGGIQMYKNMRCHSDSEILRRKMPKDLIAEFQAYCMNPKKDEPLKNGVEHGIDAYRYAELSMEQANIPLGFGSGAARRQKRL